MREKILVAGATGFIGRKLVKALKDRGYEVAVLYRNDPFSEKFYEDVEKIGPVDLTDEKVIDIITAIKPYIVINLASRTPVRFSYIDPWDYIWTNTRIAGIVALGAYKAGSNLIYASTAEVYPYTEIPVIYAEEYINVPSSPYGVSKLTSEMLIRNLFQFYKPRVKTVIMRPTNTFGRPLNELPEEARGYFIEKTLIAFMNRVSKLEFDGYPQSARQWMYYPDHVNAYLTVIANLDRIGYFETFNVAPVEVATCGEIVYYLVENKGWKVEIEWGRNPRPIDPNYLLVRTEKIRNLGWREIYSWRDGIEEILALETLRKQE